MSNIELHLKTYDELQFEVMTLVTNSYLKDLKIKELEDRIQKAIEYIENCNHGTEEYKIYEIATDGVEELLDILKGEK